MMYNEALDVKEMRQRQRNNANHKELMIRDLVAMGFTQDDAVFASNRATTMDDAVTLLADCARPPRQGDRHQRREWPLPRPQQ